MKDDGYCGMACGILLEDQQKILDLCIEHAKYDPEFAPIMVQKLIDQAVKVKEELLAASGKQIRISDNTVVQPL